MRRAFAALVLGLLVLPMAPAAQATVVPNQCNDEATDIKLDVSGQAFVGVDPGTEFDSYWVCVATTTFVASVGVDLDKTTTNPFQLDAESSICFGSSASNCIKLFEDTGVIVSVSGTVVTVTVEVNGSGTALPLGVSGTLSLVTTFSTFPVCVVVCVNVIDTAKPIVVDTGLDLVTPIGSIPLCVQWRTTTAC